MSPVRPRVWLITWPHDWPKNKTFLIEWCSSSTSLSTLTTLFPVQLPVKMSGARDSSRAVAAYTSVAWHDRFMGKSLSCWCRFLSCVYRGTCRRARALCVQVISSAACWRHRSNWRSCLFLTSVQLLYYTVKDRQRQRERERGDENLTTRTLVAFFRPWFNNFMSILNSFSICSRKKY